LGEFKSRIEKERGEEEADKTGEITFFNGGRNRRNGREKVGRNGGVLKGQIEETASTERRVWRLGERGRKYKKESE
jgi:hypothetical protein